MATVKYEEVYLRAYDSVSDARISIGRYLDLYNRHRPHSSLDGMTPIEPTSAHTECCQSPWQPNPAEVPLIEAEKLSEQAGPPQHLTDRGYQFNRDCGKAIEGLMPKTATKS